MQDSTKHSCEYQFNSESFIYNQKDDGTYILLRIDHEDETITEIHGIAKDFFTCILSNKAFAPTIQSVIEEYEVSEGDITKDLDMFLESLLKMNVIKKV